MRFYFARMYFRRNKKKINKKHTSAIKDVELRPTYNKNTMTKLHFIIPLEQTIFSGPNIYGWRVNYHLLFYFYTLILHFIFLCLSSFSSSYVIVFQSKLFHPFKDRLLYLSLFQGSCFDNELVGHRTKLTWSQVAQ